MILTATWNPRGEAQRLIRLLPRLQQVYDQIVVVIPPEAVIGGEASRQALHLQHYPGLDIQQSAQWGAGRYLALQRAVERSADAIQYADLDRLLRWVETREDEWRAIASRIPGVDCLVIGRSPRAYATHPQAIVATEAISNHVVSSFLGSSMDVSAGSKGFSRRAAECILANTRPQPALGTDAEWPLVLHKSGFWVEYTEADGLDWESADQYQEKAADASDQRRAAEAYDSNPKHWDYRVRVAMEIVDAALRVMNAE